eukprot:snap_masked-scaffold_4-processed-gene-2.34-mRNA-1 protein AED:1.00 eAED:1.00 QI:0/-1/0/0/-1/1/1/0/231
MINFHFILELVRNTFLQSADLSVNELRKLARKYSTVELKKRNFPLEKNELKAFVNGILLERLRVEAFDSLVTIFTAAVCLISVLWIGRSISEEKAFFMRQLGSMVYWLRMLVIVEVILSWVSFGGSFGFEEYLLWIRTAFIWIFKPFPPFDQFSVNVLPMVYYNLLLWLENKIYEKASQWESEEHGLSDYEKSVLIAQSLGDGTSFICNRCEEIIATHRREEHVLYWCEGN